MKRLAITMGEPGGIGPEIALRAALEIRSSSVEPILVGDESVFRAAASLLQNSAALEGLRIVHTADAGDWQKGRPTAAGGEASFQAIRRAVEMNLAGEADAVVTAPIAKEALKAAGLSWPGHTEMLAELTGTKDFAMMLVGGRLRVILVTIHTSIRKVPELITKEAILRTCRMAARGAAMLALPDARIAVAALNPHAGEDDMFGTEERLIITPAVAQAKAEGLRVSGPWPADTLFHRAAKGDFDIVVCMYHDQGLIPLKLVGFETGVNLTVGLPIIRTSPDHGTAYDIAWQGIAQHASMLEAMRLAVTMRLQ